MTTFQSLNRAYKRSDSLYDWCMSFSFAVSIPQSGLQAFRHEVVEVSEQPDHLFQSLNRAYKRSDVVATIEIALTVFVSIPQSGLQAFRRLPNPSYIAVLGSFNPSIGLTSVPTIFFPLSSRLSMLFQSLNRAYKRSDAVPEISEDQQS